MTYRVVGTSASRVDGVGKASGETVFLSDLRLPGMLFGRILRSPHPHARIRAIDTSRAISLPGVKTVLTAKDTPRIKFGCNPELSDKLPLCEDKVRFIGDEVAAVAAVDQESAEEALDLIRVEYEELPAVFTIEEALAEGAPLVHEDMPGNVAWKMERTFGDPEKVLAACPIVVEGEFQTNRACHCPLETRHVIAQWDRGGRLTLYASTQTPHVLREEVARTLGVSSARVRVLKPPTGGAFGNRLVMDMSLPLAALLAERTQRPVHMANSREEEFAVSRTRYPYRLRLRTGVTRDGRIVARTADILAENGAYHDKGPATFSFSGSLFALEYQVPNVSFRGRLIYTNSQPCTGFRGFGHPQLAFAAEQQIDEAAEKLGWDPLELRLRNANQPGVTTAPGVVLKVSGLAPCLRRAAERAGWARRRHLLSEGTRRRGIGLAAMIHSGGGSRYYGFNSAAAFVKVAKDGGVTLITSANETGQGALTAMAQMAAETLGVGVGVIQVISDDTDLTPYDLGSWGSRTTLVNGLAVVRAAAEVKRQILSAVAEAWEVAPADLSMEEGEVRVAGHPTRRLSFEEAVALAYRRRGAPITSDGKFEDALAPQCKGWDTQIPVFSSACQVAEVEVDIETGQVEVIRLTAAHDVGKAINRGGVEGQIEGALAQGVGYALMEELVLAGGSSQNGTFGDYKIPCALDLPIPETLVVEEAAPDGPFGAIGVGEPGLVPTAAAIANAVAHATGVRPRELPITPERLLTWLKGR